MQNVEVAIFFHHYPLFDEKVYWDDGNVTLMVMKLPEHEILETKHVVKKTKHDVERIDEPETKNKVRERHEPNEILTTKHVDIKTKEKKPEETKEEEESHVIVKAKHVD